jgi:hypothetical protein
MPVIALCRTKGVDRCMGSSEWHTPKMQSKRNRETSKVCGVLGVQC